ncbi:MAG: hypothetical protein J1E40_01930 [Oscillospiraceae bacterium]|nr:hypothetical protein [Oscillospiraceae bacterium]
MNIDLKRKKEKRNNIIRWLLYFLLLAISYIYMTTAPITLRTPLFLLSTAMCVSMFEEPFDSAVFGCVAGLLLDTAQGTMIGLNGIIVLWCCLMSSLLFHFFLRRYIVSIILVNLAAVFIQGMIHYFFYYAIWEYDPSGKIFTEKFLPVMIYTEIAVFPLFLLTRFMVKHFGVIVESYIEEQSDDIVRE